jgi:hypothetical protein
MRISTISPLVLAATLCLACDPSSGPSQPSDDGAAGKADGESAVLVEAADEPLGSTALRQQLCGAVAEAHPWSTVASRNAFVDDCLEHALTVTEFSRSTLFGHLDDGEPVTMMMRVRVEQEGSDNSWETSLVREFSDFQFHWAARVDSLPEGDDRDAFISDLVDDVGEFFDPFEFPDNFRALGSMNDLPPEVRNTALVRTAELDEEMRQGREDETSGAFLSDEPPHEILRDGEVVGYVVSVGYFVDHPLFDGGGAALYLNVLGDIVEEIEFFG